MTLFKKIHRIYSILSEHISDYKWIFIYTEYKFCLSRYPQRAAQMLGRIDMKHYHRLIWHIHESMAEPFPPSGCRDHTELRSEGGAEGRTGTQGCMSCGQAPMMIQDHFGSLLGHRGCQNYQCICTVSTVASCDDHIITSLQAYLILWRSRVFPPALHAFRASTLHGFYPAFRSRDAIIPHR